MKKPMNSTRRSMKSKGFSLLELMIVVVLIAGITAIAWPSIARPMRKAELSEATQKLREAIEDGRYQAMMSGEPVFLQITEGNSQLRSGGIDALINGQLDESSEGLGSQGNESRPSSSGFTKETSTARLNSGSTGLQSEASHATHAVTPKVWKLPENIIVSSVQWMDEDSGEQGQDPYGAESAFADASSNKENHGSSASGDMGAEVSLDGSDPVVGSHEKWCLPMTAQGRGRDAEITLLDKKARQTVTVSFTAATGELEIVR